MPDYTVYSLRQFINQYEMVTCTSKIMLPMVAMDKPETT